jgi:rod shape determining protein RodA
MIRWLFEWLSDWLDQIDIPLLLALLMILSASLVVLSSIGAGESNHFVIAQAARFAFGLFAMAVIARIPPNRLRAWTPFVYAATLALMPVVFAVGSGRSARLWINLGFFYLQPGELLKLSVPMMVAWYLHRAVLPPTWTTLAVCAAIIGLPAALIIIQPDLGTGLLVGASGAFALYLAGIHWWKIGMFAGSGIASLPIAWQFLHEYQKNRILTFINPELDPLGTGWNIIQSKIAIGSGGWFGKGWGNSSQAKLDYLPEHATDFLFSVLSEEWGWVGVIVIFSLYAFVIGRCLWIAANARDGYARILSGALAMTFSIYVLVNGCMIAGLLPVVGVPMPLLSYGGTSAVSLLAGFGIVMSAKAHRKLHGT